LPLSTSASNLRQRPLTTGIPTARRGSSSGSDGLCAPRRPWNSRFDLGN
jgi:hypothetical protein